MRITLPAGTKLVLFLVPAGAMHESLSGLSTANTHLQEPGSQSRRSRGASLPSTMPEVMLCNECLFLAAKSLLEGDDDGRRGH